ncbi:hypothetical protein GMSM_25810 [Geomonas sp. Red276]
MEYMLGSKEWQYFTTMRKKEITLYTTALAIKACSDFSPVLRLPPIVNTLHADLQRLAACSRGNSSHKKFKLNKLYKEVAKKLSNVVDAEYIKVINGTTGHIKIVSDSPLEWLRIDGLPLMLRNSASRIPTTPGNLFFAKMVQNFPLVVPVSAFSEVLIIRSFHANDLLKKSLTDAVNLFTSVASQTTLTLRFVDVSCKQDFIDALNSYNGALMIYDGHGKHDKETGVGGLVIGDEVIDVWSLKGEVRIPPIVILSACDTHPIDASHATTANGFIRVGALTVLSTVLPVSGFESARFIGRLIYRIAEYLPLYTNTIDKPIRWNTVITGMQRMVYVTELIYHINTNLMIPIADELRKKIGQEANNFINSNSPYWYEQTLDFVSDLLYMSRSNLTERLEEQPMFSETLKYLQIGSPENILISNKSLDGIIM